MNRRVGFLVVFVKEFEVGFVFVRVRFFFVIVWAEGLVGRLRRDYYKELIVFKKFIGFVVGFEME